MINLSNVPNPDEKIKVVLKQAIKNREKLSGCTVHYVTQKLDSGKIIMQRKVKITIKDNKITLARKVLKKEHQLYPDKI